MRFCGRLITHGGNNVVTLFVVIALVLMAAWLGVLLWPHRTGGNHERPCA
jgi:hypothetical protein